MSMTARPPALGKLDLEQGVLAVDYVQVSLPIWCSAVTTHRVRKFGGTTTSLILSVFEKFGKNQ
jgi:hypothetical protein